MAYNEVPRIELNQDGTVTFFVNIGGFRVGTPVETSGYASQTNGATATFRYVEPMPQSDPVEGAIVVVKGVPVIGPAFTAQDPIMVVVQAADVWITKLDQDTGDQKLSPAITTAKEQSAQINPMAAWNSDGTTYHSMLASPAASGSSPQTWPQAPAQPAAPGIRVSSAEDARQAAEDDAAALVRLNFASVGQIYETTVHADGVPSMRFVSVPRRTLDSGTTDSGVALDLFEFLEILGVQEPVIRQFSLSQLPIILYQCLLGELFPGIPVAFFDPRADLTSEDRRLVDFAEYLSFEDLIPFELSDQQSRSLGKIILSGATTGAALGAVGAGAKIGAAGGFVIGAPAGPLVFITVPAGFVVGGLVGAVTEALGERLYDRLRKHRRPKPS